jgi:hypothetical protein
MGRLADSANVFAGTPPVRHDHRPGLHFGANMELQAAIHSRHADVTRAPASQMHHQTNIRGGEQQQNQNICRIHTLI